MQNFINSLIDSIPNGIRKSDGNSRSTKGSFARSPRTSTKGEESRRTNGILEKESFCSERRTFFSNFSRRIVSTLRRICLKGKQRKTDSRNYKEIQSWQKAKQVIGLIPFYLFFNPQLIYTLIYIDSLFMDELISINIIQLNHIYSMLHNPTNIELII